MLSAQRELEGATGERLVGTSLADTVASCLALGNLKVALRLQRDFRMGERHFTWLRMAALVTANDWEGLDRLSKEKRGAPPGDVPLGAFVDACVDASAPDGVTKRFIARLIDPEVRAEAYERR